MRGDSGDDFSWPAGEEPNFPDVPEALSIELPAGVIAGTDLASAYLLVRRHGADLCYCAELDWLVWDGMRWQRDQMGEVHRRLHDIGRSLEMSAKQLRIASAKERRNGNAEEANALAAEAKRIGDWGTGLQRKKGMSSAENVARDLSEVRVRANAFDRDPGAISCLTGTYVGEMMPHRREDMITRLANTGYARDAEAPIWEAFLERIQPDPEIRAFLQRALGYSLTGHTGEQCMFVCHGHLGANGKSTLLETVRYVLGDYAVHVQGDTLMSIGRARGADNDLMRLRGARFVTAIETEEGRKLDEPRIKSLTGGDTMTARLLYHEPVEFVPVAKIWLATNHKPDVNGSDEAIWRRLRLIPFEVQIPEEERDPNIGHRMRSEAPGILAWMLDGMSQWMDGGLRPPEAVMAATREWREESDELAKFIFEMCVRLPSARCAAGQLYSAYADWARASGTATPLTMTAFGRRLSELGYRESKSSDRRWRNGLGLRNVGSGGDGE